MITDERRAPQSADYNKHFDIICVTGSIVTFIKRLNIKLYNTHDQ